MGGKIRWSNVGVIFRREVRDQFRDRRTLFMVFALPILLYPILGIGMAQLAATFEQKPRTVVLVGSEHLPPAPPLLNPTRDRFLESFFDRPSDAGRLRVELGIEGVKDLDRPGTAREAIRGGLADAVVIIPADVVTQLAESGTADIPVLFDSTDEPSEITGRRVRDVLERWRDLIVKGRLERDQKPPGYTEPVRVATEDVAPANEAGGSLWGRMFPFLLVLMALTGAFYPAVDLCAGEKERGTMETLLISPASRGEIVLGKFFTVMLASVTTAVLNLASMGLTGIQLAASVGGMGNARLVTAITPPASSAYLWMLLLLIPLSGFFSAICVALAVLARSMKEGQYYMTPLYLVTFPLTLITLAPEISLDLFYSVVPITGVALLLKALIVGDYGVARQFFVPVLVPTIIYALLALRWAVDQFNREEVVFREAEVFDLRGWLRFRMHDKSATPGPSLAAFGFALILSMTWFSGLLLPRLFAMLRLPESAEGLVSMATVHVGVILGVPVLLTVIFCSRPGAALRLRMPTGRDLLLAAGLALAINPAVRELAHYVEFLFPATETVRNLFADLAKQVPNLWVALLIFAILPAISEEFAFRGFILAGLEKSYDTRTAILLSSFLFGFLHVLMSLFQQLFTATLLGLVLGLMAVRTRSLWPGILFHFLNNAQAILIQEAGRNPAIARATGWLFRDRDEALYQWPVVVAGGVISAVLLRILMRSGPAKDPAGVEELG
ncbi:ABC transporter permease subunit/CPBP intramembrane protease [Tundrisphaera sp. TA3]|uniref:ABC transporter permease subunit/CPBP intramembrane protease n=1 Tax=Tundrisphaera sp. TA3 TaxID=3435775 RepID=UPI003EBE8F0F